LSGITAGFGARHAYRVREEAFSMHDQAIPGLDVDGTHPASQLGRVDVLSQHFIQ
jgi:hypothetical protein